MRRRAFLAGAAAAAAWTRGVRAQNRQPVVGFLGSASAQQWAPLVKSFFDGLKEYGFVEGQNVKIEYRWADGQYERLAGFASDLIRDGVDLIVAIAPPAALAAKKASTSVPIVFMSGADPVKLGLVASVNKPGGNVTGVNFVTAELGPKILEFILELIPQASRIALLVNQDNQNTVAQAKDIQGAAQSVGRDARIAYANSEQAIDKAFESLAEYKPEAVIIATDAFFLSRKDQMVGLPRRYGIPAIYSLREYPLSGGLVSYGPSLPDAYRQLGGYAGRILKGGKPADLPVMQPTKFDLVINLNTAKAFGLTVPPTLLVRADEVIE